MHTYTPGILGFFRTGQLPQVVRASDEVLLRFLQDIDDWEVAPVVKAADDLLRQPAPKVAMGFVWVWLVGWFFFFFSSPRNTTVATTLNLSPSP